RPQLDRRCRSAALLFHSLVDHHTPPSFPTRRSSDLHHPRHLRHGGDGHARLRGGRGRREPERSVADLRRDHSSSSWNALDPRRPDRKSTRLNSSHVKISYAVFCLKKKKNNNSTNRFS